MKFKKIAVLSLLGLLALSGCKRDSSGSGSSEGPVGPDWDNFGWNFPGWDGDGGSSDVGDPVEDAAEGVKNFVNNPVEDRAEILRLLEKYTLENFLGGIPYRDNSGYVMYNPRLEIPADDYVVGYGFGVGEALITDPLTHPEITPKHAMYYHSWQSEDPGTINYMNAQDSVSSDLYGLVSASYWSTKFNGDKTGYEWYPLLADDVDRPVPGADYNEETGMATKWKVPVRLGDDLKYNTLSDVAKIKAFDGRKVAIEDYLTPFKLMLDNKWFRATDLGSRSSGFVGVTNYLRAKDPSWDSVGIQIGDDEKSLEFTFNTPKTAFKAMYSLSSSLFSPIPMDFIDAIGGAKEFGKPNVDSTLSLGVYTLEEWDNDKQVVFKKNPNYIEKEKYTHEGYVYAILEDNDVAFQEFHAGKLDSAGVPSAYLQRYKEDERSRQTKGDTVWKLQVNAADEDLWDSLFGDEGSVAPGGEWDLKPVMSNRKFLEGLYLSLDRDELADKTGSRPAQAFLSEAYMVDAEAGISWRQSEEGKAVLDDLVPETNGYDIELARGLFNSALDELVAANKYTRGTANDPTVIKIGLHFQTATQITGEGAELKRLIEGAFNGFEGESNIVDGFKLELDMYATASWMDAYYAAMDGEFDMAFGSISGNTLDPIDFMETVMSDNRSGFTLSWGTDTSIADEALTFDGEVYSFNALQQSALGLTVVENGREATLVSFDKLAWTHDPATKSVKLSASGSYYDDEEFVITPDGSEADEVEPINDNGLLFMGLAIYNRDGEFIGVLDFDPTTFADGKWTVEIEEIPRLIEEGAFYLDFYINTVSTYGETVEPKTLIVETLWPFYEAQLL